MKALFRYALAYYCTVFYLLLNLSAQYSVDIISEPIGNQCNGTIGIVNNSSFPIASYEWSTENTSSTITNLCAGVYSVTLSDNDGCQYDLSVTIGSCFIADETFNATITESCRRPTSGKIEISNPSLQNYNFSWSDGSSGAINSNLSPGTYCVTIQETTNNYCFRSDCFEVPLGTACQTETAPVIINELSNGNSSGQEYIELLVLGNTNCSARDIREVIVDDNDGTFSNTANGYVGTGISPGHIRFIDDPTWSSVPPKSLIVIYNPSNRNPNLPQSDDPYDANSDGVYILPVNHPLLEMHPSMPDVQNPEVYDVFSEFYTQGNWNSLLLLDSGDAIQVRSKDGIHFHGISYGGYTKITGGPDNMKVSDLPGIRSNYSFTDGSINERTNFIVSLVTVNGSQTPGTANNSENVAYIAGLCDDKVPNDNSTDNYADPNDIVISHEVYPNPIAGNFSLIVKVDGKESLEGEIIIHDLLGKQSMKQPATLLTGEHHLNFSTKEMNMPPGIYILSFVKNGKIIFLEKIIKI